MADAALNIREVLDALRSYHAKNVKPFLELPRVIEGALQIIEHDLPAARRELAQLTDRVAAVRAEIPNVEAVAAEAKARVMAVQRQATEAETAAHNTIQRAEMRARDHEALTLRTAEALSARMEEEFNTRKAALTTELTALETKKTALDEAIAAVRAKF